MQVELDQTPAAPTGPGPDEVLAMVREILHADAIVPDADGDVPLRIGGTLAFVRAASGAARVEIFSIVLTDVDPSPALLERLNELNCVAGLVKYAIHEDTVIAVTLLAADPLVKAHLDRALREFAALVEGVDEDLQAQFGGQRMFAQAMASRAWH